MVKRLQLRRGTTSQHSTFTGADGELTVDTDKKTVVVHNGSTAGGIPLARADIGNMANGAVAMAKIARPGSPSQSQVIRVNSTRSGFEYGQVGPVSCQVFTSSGTWTKPSGVTRVQVQVVGGGGGGSQHSESGGSGGYTEKLIDVRDVSTVAVTVGGGGAGSTYGGGAPGHGVGNGGTSSFGSYCTSTGGIGANYAYHHAGGLPGVGSGGNVNLYGGGGAGHSPTDRGVGQSRSYFGGSCLGVHGGNAGHAHGHETHAAPGCGGGGCNNHGPRGANGRDGIVVVWEYK